MWFFLNFCFGVKWVLFSMLLLHNYLQSIVYFCEVLLIYISSMGFISQSSIVCIFLDYDVNFLQSKYDRFLWIPVDTRDFSSWTFGMIEVILIADSFMVDDSTLEFLDNLECDVRVIRNTSGACGLESSEINL